MAAPSSMGPRDIAKLIDGVRYKTQGGHPGFAAVLWASGCADPVIVPVQVHTERALDKGVVKWLTERSKAEDIRFLTVSISDDAPPTAGSTSVTMTVAYIDQVNKGAYADNVAVAKLVGAESEPWKGSILVMGTNEDRTVYRDLTAKDVWTARSCVMCLVKDRLAAFADEKDIFIPYLGPVGGTGLEVADA